MPFVPAIAGAVAGAAGSAAGIASTVAGVVTTVVGTVSSAVSAAKQAAKATAEVGKDAKTAGVGDKISAPMSALDERAEIVGERGKTLQSSLEEASKAGKIKDVGAREASQRSHGAAALGDINDIVANNGAIKAELEQSKQTALAQLRDTEDGGKIKQLDAAIKKSDDSIAKLEKADTQLGKQAASVSKKYKIETPAGPSANSLDAYRPAVPEPSFSMNSAPGLLSGSIPAEAAQIALPTPDPTTPSIADHTPISRIGPMRI